MRNVWPNTAVDCPDLAWLLSHHEEIVRNKPGTRQMPKTRPIKVWPDGRVRIEFVGTYATAAFARQCLERYTKGAADER